MTLPLHPGRAFGAFLFDMDGTILSSMAATERIWSNWARNHGLDLETFLPTIFGVRTSEVIARLNLPDIDVKAEAATLLRAELDDLDGIVPIQGAEAFLASLPADRWAVVTSAPRELARRRLRAAGLPFPPIMVAGDEVSRGKPDPECFLLAASRLGQEPQDCLVFEDAIAGIGAAEAAGMSVAVVTATHSHGLGTPHPTLASYDSFAVRPDEFGRLTIASIAHSAQTGL